MIIIIGRYCYLNVNILARFIISWLHSWYAPPRRTVCGDERFGVPTGQLSEESGERWICEVDGPVTIDTRRRRKISLKMIFDFIYLFFSKQYRDYWVMCVWCRANRDEKDTGPGAVKSKGDALVLISRT